MKILTIKEIKIQQALGTLDPSWKLKCFKNAKSRIIKSNNRFCKFCGKKFEVGEKVVNYELRKNVRGTVCTNCQYMSLATLQRDCKITIPELQDIIENTPLIKTRLWNTYGLTSTTAKVLRARKCKLCGFVMKQVEEQCIEVPDNYVSHFTMCPECRGLSFMTLISSLPGVKG